MINFTGRACWREEGVGGIVEAVREGRHVAHENQSVLKPPA